MKDYQVENYSENYYSETMISMRLMRFGALNKTVCVKLK